MLFVGEDYPSRSHWREIKGAEAVNILSNISKSEISLRNKFDIINSCLDQKNVSCLRDPLGKDEFSFAKVAHLLWNYTNLPCDVVEDYSGYDVHETANSDEERTKILKNTLIPWESLKKVFSVDLKNDEVDVSTNNFGEINMFNIHTNEEEFCKGDAQKSIGMYFQNEGTLKYSYWKIIFVGFTKRNKPWKKIIKGEYPYPMKN